MSHTPGQVRDGLARCFLRNGIDRPQMLADLAEPIVAVALEERDRMLTEQAAESDVLRCRLAELGALEDIP